MDSPIQSSHEECPDIPAFRQRRQNLAKLMSPKSTGTVSISKARISLNMCLDDSRSFHDNRICPTKMLCPLLALLSLKVTEQRRIHGNTMQYKISFKQTQLLWFREGCQMI